VTPNAEEAFNALLSMGVSVMPWGVEDGYCESTQFVLIWANDDGSEIYADIDGRHIRESLERDKLINCRNIREDIHAILCRHKLSTDWANSGQMVVMDGPDATGYRHDKCGKWAIR
jgi:hypothetical protein